MARSVTKSQERPIPQNIASPHFPRNPLFTCTIIQRAMQARCHGSKHQAGIKNLRAADQTCNIGSAGYPQELEHMCPPGWHACPSVPRTGGPACPSQLPPSLSLCLLKRNLILRGIGNYCGIFKTLPRSKHNCRPDLAPWLLNYDR